MRLRSLWLRAGGFVARHSYKIGLAIVVTTAAVGLGGVRWEADQRADSDRAAFAAIDAAANEREDQICEGLRSGQRADRLLIDAVLEAPAQDIPLLDVESFAGLPPAVQTYVRDLAADEPLPAGTSLAERLTAHRDNELGPDDLPTFCT